MGSKVEAQTWGSRPLSPGNNRYTDAQRALFGRTQVNSIVALSQGLYFEARCVIKVIEVMLLIDHVTISLTFQIP